ncbi:MAG: mannose-1-phosphate guanylyltransferase/mannose-6-phosphate isomerase [Sphingomonadales bacterium]
MSQPRILPVILSGGAGTRLWPLSRQSMPKQMIDLLGTGFSLMQQTLKRVSGPAFTSPLILGNQRHTGLIDAQLTGIDVSGDVILEPEARNTAPAVALAVAHAASRGTADQLLILPSDHVIRDEAAFRDAVVEASKAAETGRLVTFGIAPHRPETGFGYIEMGARLDGFSAARALQRFVEKPNLETAQSYLAAGNFVWNAGMFLFSVDAATQAFETYATGILSACQKALDTAEKRGAQIYPNKDAFAQADSISFDYAIMEKAEKAAVVPCDIGWSDIGSFEGLWEVLDKDGDGNATIGDVTLLECSNCLAFSSGSAITMTGLTDQVIIATGDVVTVLPKEKSQDVKALRQVFADQDRPEADRF